MTTHGTTNPYARVAIGTLETQLAVANRQIADLQALAAYLRTTGAPVVTVERVVERIVEVPSAALDPVTLANLAELDAWRTGQRRRCRHCDAVFDRIPDGPRLYESDRCRKLAAKATYRERQRTKGEAS